MSFNVTKMVLPWFFLAALYFPVSFEVENNSHSLVDPAWALSSKSMPLTSNMFVDIAKQQNPAVVSVSMKAKPPKTDGQFKNPRRPGQREQFRDFYDKFFRQQPGPRRDENPRRGGGAGSGFIIDADGHILTNNHVVEGADELLVNLDGDKEYTATLIGTDPKTDLALIRINREDGDNTPFPYLRMGDSDKLEVLRSCYKIQPGEVDLSTFPLFSLFGVGIGMTSILPEMDFTHPAKVNPEKILNTITKYNITSGFGSPALWDTISRYCISNNRHLSSLNRILMAGAPIPGSLIKRFDHILEPKAKIHTPYGATEALPVTSIERKEILEDTLKKSQQGYGTCVGQTVPDIELRIIEITDNSIPEWKDSIELTHGEIGEIAVKGPWVTRNYFKRDNVTRLAKIKDRGNSFWHRMGDVGYIDDKNRLWFCGRKSQRVRTANGTLFTIQCEGVFNAHPKVKRSALVGVGKIENQKPVIIIEPEHFRELKNNSARNSLIKELLALGGQYNHTHQIKDILIYQNFPVDIRHNAKISREQLAQWATCKTLGKCKR